VSATLAVGTTSARFHQQQQEGQMREGPDVLVNALAGERVIFGKHAADTGGQLIQFDLVLTKVGGNPPPHIHLHQTERFVVRSGALRVMVADEERELREGEEALIPAGTAHRWWNAGPGDALVSVEMRPGLHFEELLDEAFRLVDEGKFGEQGPIDQAATSAWAEKWQQEYRLA
jgi:mannose-6-phosphate isomerase-like protein (cupin superfamily)